MTFSKSKIRSAVTSSFIRRAENNDELTDIYNSFNLPTHAPYEEPSEILPKNKFDSQRTFDMKFLSKVENKVLVKINSMILDKTKATDPVYLDLLAQDLDHPISTLKKTIQKLEHKGLISRILFKPGRGGWTVYSVNDLARAKPEPNQS